MAIIEVERLTKFYGKSRGIVDVSFSQEAGEIFGFIGPNGAGKSTTIRLLLSLIRPTSGTARVFGKDVTRDGPEIRRDIGYLPSEVFYYEGMKVVDLLKYSASFFDRDCTKRITSQRWGYRAGSIDGESSAMTSGRSSGSKGHQTSWATKP